MKSSKAFTIVELLIVIVVIGILASITIVAYNGIQNRARSAAASSALNQAAKKLAVHHVDSSTYPASLSDVGISDANGVTYKYYPNNPTTPTGYCMTATNAGTTYSVSSSSAKPQDGDCTTNGLAGWWKFDGNANDSSGNNNNGTVTGAILTTGQDGRSNSAYAFDGTTGFITHSTNGILPTMGTFSVWVNPTKQSGWGIWQTQSGINSPSWIAIFPHTDTVTYFRMGNGSACCNNDLTFNTTTYIPINQWTHLTFTWGNGIMKAYQNGALVAQRSATFQNAIDPFARIGDSHNTKMQGRMDDVRIYSRALSANEVLSTYNSGAK